MKIKISIVLGTLLCVAGMFNASLALAASSITITTFPPVGCQITGTTITIGGTAIADPPPGNVTQYHVQILWGDNTQDNVTESSPFGPEDPSTRTFSGSHTYLVGGNYTIKARVYHQNPNGNDGQADAVASTSVCITNPQATLTLVKTVTNDNGGTAAATAWTLTAAGPTPLSGATGSPAVTNATVNPGVYTLSETGGPSGYTASLYSCVKNSGAPVVSNTITLANGDTATCTINNNDIQPKLTVTKVVVNDNGGTKIISDFPLFVSATPVTSGVQNGFNAGTYTVSETGASTYLGVITGDCALNGSITLALGDVKSCTITNNDIAPKLHLRKLVINDNGGSASVTSWTLMADGTGSNDLSGTTPVDSTGTLKADTWALSETGGPSGYMASAWNCVGGTMGDATHITLGLNEEATCTITNDDIQPKLTVTKVVMNNNGGVKVVGDFPLFVDVTPVTSGAQNGFNAGAHTVSETGDTTYQETISGDCAANGSITLLPGDVKSCTITNDDIAPILHLVKTVTNNNGGTAVDTAWTLMADGTGSNDISGTTPVDSGATLQADTFTLSESGGPSGYAASSWVCVGGTQVGSTIMLGLGQEATCTINNDDIAPTLTLVKTVTNNNGGTKVVSDFPLFINASPVVSGVPATLTANTLYTATETNSFGYAPSVWGTDCTAGGTITLQPGENKTCTITNDDIAPQLTVIKHVINDDGNTAVAGDFTMTVTGTNVSSASFPGSESPGTTVTLNQGTYSANEISNAGYTETLSADCSGTINVGETKTCTITNNDKPMPTRGQGFWQTHTTYTLSKVGSWTLGTKTINSTNVFSAFYVSIPKKSNGTKRGALDQARIQMLQQWVAAKLNCAAFGCNATVTTLTNNAATAWTSGTASQILSYATQLETYNNSNEAIVIAGQGRATPQASQTQAASGFVMWDLLP